MIIGIATFFIFLYITLFIETQDIKDKLKFEKLRNKYQKERKLDETAKN